MPSAGDYNRRFEWFVRTLGTPKSAGQKPEAFTSQGHLWGALDDVATADQVEHVGRDTQETTATVRVRNLPTIAAGDRLTDAGFGEVWEVLTARRGDDERVCEVRNDRR